MNQTQAAAEIAKRINQYDEFRAKVSLKKGVIVMVEADSGGKKGWVDAGEITVGQEITVSDTTKFKLRYFPEILESALAGIAYEFEQVQQPGGEIKAAQLAKAARDFRAGKVVEDSVIVDCVAGGYLTQNEAMNRDF